MDAGLLLPFTGCYESHSCEPEVHPVLNSLRTRHALCTSNPGILVSSSQRKPDCGWEHILEKQLRTLALDSRRDVGDSKRFRAEGACARFWLFHLLPVWSWTTKVPSALQPLGHLPAGSRASQKHLVCVRVCACVCVCLCVHACAVSSLYLWGIQPTHIRHNYLKTCMCIEHAIFATIPYTIQ